MRAEVPVALASSPSSSGRASAAAPRPARWPGRLGVARQHDPVGAVEVDRDRAALRRAPHASRAPSSRSTSGCRSRSQARTRRASVASSSACASAGSSSGTGPPSHASAGTQRYLPSVHAPRGRPRTSSPSIASWGRTRAAALCVDSHFVPAPSRSREASSGTAFVRSAVNASPRASTSARAAAQARSSHGAGALRDRHSPRRSPRAGGAPAPRPPSSPPPRRPRRARAVRPRASAASRASARATARRRARARRPRRDALRSRPDGQEDRRGVGRVQRDERAGRLGRASGSRLRREPVPPHQPGAPLLDRDTPHRKVVPAGLYSNTDGTKIPTVWQFESAASTARRGRAPT